MNDQVPSMDRVRGGDASCKPVPDCAIHATVARCRRGCTRAQHSALKKWAALAPLLTQRHRSPPCRQDKREEEGDRGREKRASKSPVTAATATWPGTGGQGPSAVAEEASGGGSGRPPARRREGGPPSGPLQRKMGWLPHQSKPGGARAAGGGLHRRRGGVRWGPVGRRRRSCRRPRGDGDGQGGGETEEEGKKKKTRKRIRRKTVAVGTKPVDGGRLADQRRADGGPVTGEHGFG